MLPWDPVTLIGELSHWLLVKHSFLLPTSKTQPQRLLYSASWPPVCRLCCRDFEVGSSILCLPAVNKVPPELSIQTRPSRSLLPPAVDGHFSRQLWELPVAGKESGEGQSRFESQEEEGECRKKSKSHFRSCSALGEAQCGLEALGFGVWPNSRVKLPCDPYKISISFGFCPISYTYPSAKNLSSNVFLLRRQVSQVWGFVLFFCFFWLTGSL